LFPAISVNERGTPIVIFTAPTIWEDINQTNAVVADIQARHCPHIGEGIGKGDNT
jgi:hypothetical protein